MTHLDRRRVLADLGDTRRDWFHLEVRNEVVGEQSEAGETATASTADVYIFDRIGGWGGVTAEDFVRDVAGLDVEHIDLHLNSPGGDVWEGVAIANVLRQHQADVTVWVDGIAASAASVIAMAGDEIVMSIGAQMMIHDASTVTWGNAAQLRKDAEMLDSASNSIAGTYAAKAGGTAAEWRAVMVAETWYTAEEAVAAGLADRVATDDDKASASGEQIVPGSSHRFWDLWDSLSDADRHADTVRALFAHAGRSDAPPPQMPGRPARSTQTPAASAGGSTPSQEGATMPSLIEGLSQRLGIADDADEATILAAVDEALAERADPPTPTAALPEGAVPVDKGVYDQLVADATAGRQAREQQLADHRAQLVENALRTGSISPANKAGWLNKLRIEGEAAEKDLQSLAPGLVPVNETGHDQQPAPQDDLSWFGAAPAKNSQEG